MPGYEQPNLPGAPMTEKEAFSAPNALDIKETENLFADFCLPHIQIPEFSTRNELIRWRTKAIKTGLDTHNDTPSLRLSSREVDVMTMIRQGCTIHEIASKIRITEQEAKAACSRLRKQMKEWREWNATRTA